MVIKIKKTVPRKVIKIHNEIYVLVFPIEKITLQMKKPVIKDYLITEYKEWRTI